MSSGDLYKRDGESWGDSETRIRRAKAVRRERLRPIREALKGLSCDLRMDYTDSEKVRLDGGGQGTLPLDLRGPFDLAAVLDYLDECLDEEQEWLDNRRERIEHRRDVSP